MQPGTTLLDAADSPDAARTGAPPAVSASLLDRMPVGVLVLGTGSDLRYANVAARIALVSGEAGLRLDDPVVGPVAGAARRAWAAALAEVAAGHTRLLRLGAGGRRRAISLSPWPLRSGGAGVMCTLPAAEASQAATLAAWARAHDLSAAESDVLLALARGAAPKAVAQLRGSTEGTVRSQIKTILQKTGHRGIRELVVEVLRSAPVPIAAGGGVRGDMRPPYGAE